VAVVVERVTRGAVVGGGDKTDEGFREVDERIEDADDEVLCRPRFEVERAVSLLAGGARLGGPDFGTISCGSAGECSDVDGVLEPSGR
jgi:hypothetical protein